MSEKMKLGEICNFINGRAFKPSEWDKKGLPIVRIQNLNDENAEFNFCSKAIEDKYIIEDNQLLFSWSGTPGTSFGAFFWNRGKAVLNQHIFKVIPKININIEFLRYLLNGNLDIIISKSHGGVGLQHITKRELEEIIVDIPDDKRQEYVAKTLNGITKIINTRKEQLKQFDEIIKSQFVEMFGDPFLNDKKWKTNTIGNCCTLKSGNSLSAEVENEGGDVLYVKVGDMNLKGNEKYITTSSHKVTRKTAGKGIFELGTILFPKRGGAIGTNKKRLTNSKVCADLNIMGVTPIKEIISEYLFTYFLFIDLGTLNNGSSVPQINNKDIEPLIIQIPPIELQNQFAEIVKQIDKQKFEIESSLREMQELYEALMERYFG